MSPAEIVPWVAEIGPPEDHEDCVREINRLRVALQYIVDVADHADQIWAIRQIAMTASHALERFRPL